MSRGLPEGFVYLDSWARGVASELFYAGTQNFLGQPVDGYRSGTQARCLTTRIVAQALAGIQAELAPKGLGIKVYDSYRPQDAVDHFERWTQDASEQRMKEDFYPGVDKAKMFELGYIAKRSTHTRGAAVDLTLIRLGSAKPGPRPAGWVGYWDAEHVCLDMGLGVDGFDQRAHHGADGLTVEQNAHRAFFLELMVRHGFRPYALEIWHYTINDEMFPDRYFNFPIE